MRARKRCGELDGLGRWGVVAFHVLLLVPALAVPVGCSSDLEREAIPSPVPAGYVDRLEKAGGPALGQRRDAREDERVVDGLIGVVGDAFLTRREVERRLRVNDVAVPPDPDILEVEIDKARVDWAEEQLLKMAAQQAGLTISPAQVDQFAQKQIEDRLEKASEAAGRPIEREEWLAARNVSWREFRDDLRDRAIADTYLIRTVRGIGDDIRPSVDWEVSPGEVRRLVAEQQDLLREPARVRLALFQFFISGLADDAHTPSEWQDLAEKKAGQLIARFRRGEDPQALIEAFGLDEEKNGFGNVQAAAVPLVGSAERLRDKAQRAWLLDPARQPRDTFLVRDPSGPLVVGVVEMTPSRALSYAEAHDKIVEHLREGMFQHAKARLIIDLLERGAVVSPGDLEDLLLDEAFQLLDAIKKDPVLRRARLK